MRARTEPASAVGGGARLGILAATLLVTVGCNETAAKESPSKKAPPPSPVATIVLEEQPFLEKRSFFGQVRAVSDAHLGAAESGRVRSVRIVEGDTVKKGQLLVELDDQLARVQLNEAMASRKQTDARSEQAKFEVERYGKLREEQVVSELEASRKESEAQTLEAVAQEDAARVARETERLRRHRITAPFDGTITELLVDPGDWLNAGEVALQLVTSGHVEVDVHVPASMLDALGNLKEVSVVYGKRRVSARVASAVDALDPETRTALLRVTPQEDAKGLRVGAGVYVQFVVVPDEGINVPRDAIVYGVAKPRLFVFDDGKAQPLNVDIIATADDRALVQSDELKVGDRLIIRGNERLRPGQPVVEDKSLVPQVADKAEKKP